MCVYLKTGLKLILIYQKLLSKHRISNKNYRTNRFVRFFNYGDASYTLLNLMLDIYSLSLLKKLSLDQKKVSNLI
jgi:hypothetical protein